MKNPFDELREAHRRLTGAQERHMALMHAAIAGEPYDPEELMASAKEVQARHAEFMKAGEPIIHRKKG